MTVLMPAGTFYVFPNVEPICRRLGITSHGLAMYLLEGGGRQARRGVPGRRVLRPGGPGLPALQLRRAGRAAGGGGGVLGGRGHADGSGEGVSGDESEVSLKLTHGYNEACLQQHDGTCIIDTLRQKNFYLSLLLPFMVAWVIVGYFPNLIGGIVAGSLCARLIFQLIRSWKRDIKDMVDLLVEGEPALCRV